MATKVLLILFGLGSASAWISGEPCDVSVWPETGSPKVIFRLVPGGCSEGEFRWDYPQKSVHLEFPNIHAHNISVCIRDEMLGNIFTIRDITHGIGMPMIIGQKESCTMPHKTAVILQIDAPKVLYYVATVRYRVQAE